MAQAQNHINFNEYLSANIIVKWDGNFLICHKWIGSLSNNKQIIIVCVTCVRGRKA